MQKSITNRRNNFMKGANLMKKEKRVIFFNLEDKNLTSTNM